MSFFMKSLAEEVNRLPQAVFDYAKRFSRCWMNGELTGEQMKEALLASRRKLAAQERQNYA